MMIFKAVLIAALIIVLILFVFRDNSLKRNISKLWSMIIIGAVLVVILSLVFSILKNMRSFGEGALFSDMVSMGRQAQEEAVEVEGDTLKIEVKQSEILIGGNSYLDAYSAKDILTSAKEQGIKKIIITDDYALKTAYDELISVLTDIGFSESDISREEIP